MKTIVEKCRQWTNERMEAKHTALPWRITKTDDGPAISTTLPNGITVGYTWHIAYLANATPKSNKKEIDANAAFIVQAVNNHEKLKGMLKICLAYCKNRNGIEASTLVKDICYVLEQAEQEVK